jgi:type II secretion system (T2SS) protein E
VAQRLGEVLVAQGACTAEAVREALQNQVIFGGRLGTNLLELGAVAEEALARALGQRHGVPSLFGPLQVDPRAVGLMTADLADRCDAVPYLLADRKLALLAVDPSDLAMLDEVAFVTGKRVHPIVVPEARIWALLRQAYGIERQLRGIEVDFGRAGSRIRMEAPAPRTPPAGPDLMDEAEFKSLYAKVGVGQPSPAAAPRTTPDADDAVLELTDEIGPPEPLQDPHPDLSVEVVEPLAPPLGGAEDLIAPLAGGEGHAPPSAFVPATAVTAEEPEPSPLRFEEAVQALAGVTERDAIARIVLRYARSKFRRAVLLTVNGGVAQGWAGLGEKLGPAAVGRIRLPLGTPGLVDTVVSTRAHLLGPIPKTEANVRLLKLLGGGVPGNAFLVPILALGRVVNVFYADNGKGGVVDASDLGDLLILATRISQSYEAMVSRAA